MPDGPDTPETPKTPTALVPTTPAAGLAAAPSTARRLAEASVSPNTRRAYTGALRRLDTSRAELAARRGAAFSAPAQVTEAELVWYPHGPVGGRPGPRLRHAGGGRRPLPRPTSGAP